MFSSQLKRIHSIWPTNFRAPPPTLLKMLSFLTSLVSYNLFHHKLEFTLQKKTYTVLCVKSLSFHALMVAISLIVSNFYILLCSSQMIGR